ncbi:MAG: STAS domain-containing protein [Actinomycetota bacterium]|nr:STAS domain-containing protein [Actinomycetota bacterium]
MPIIEDAAGGVTGEPHRADPDLSDSVDKSTTHVASPEPLLDLSVTYPVPGVCVVQVVGELDMLTAPQLTKCLVEELSASPPHLVLDMQAVPFIGSAGLYALFKASELAQARGSVLHLAGMDQRAVSRELTVAGLLPYFRTYPTLEQALSALTG